MIETKITCEICKQEIIPIKKDAIAIQGNLCVIDNLAENGVGGGILGGGKWIQNIVEFTPEEFRFNPFKCDDIPVHHIHIDCINNLLSTNKRA